MLAGMRVCLVYDCLFPHTVGGAERWYRDLAERLCAEGHEVTYLTLRQWERGERAQIDPRVRVVTRRPAHGPVHDGRPPAHAAAAGVRRWACSWHLLRHGRRYDVVHTCAFPYFSLLAAGAARPLAASSWWSTGSRCGAAPTGATTWARSAGAWACSSSALCARVPQRAFCFSRAARAAAARGGPARHGDGAARAVRGRRRAGHAGADASRWWCSRAG